MTPSEVLLSAANTLEKRGLCREGLLDEHGRLGLTKAIDIAAREDFDTYYAARMQLANHLQVTKLLVWAQGRSDADVVSAMREAARA